MIDYTGHFMVDIGLATITAFAHKRHPTQLTKSDLKAAADYMYHNYTQEPLRSFLSVAFTSNAWFIQSAYDPNKAGLEPEQREQRIKERQLWAKRHLYQWMEQVDSKTEERDIFTGDPIAPLPLSKRLKAGRGGRVQIPLTLGDKNINFLPYGEAGVPVSGLTVLAISMMPLGCAKVGGRLLAVHSDNEKWIMYFARTFLRENRQKIQLAQAAGSKKMPEPPYSQRTFLIQTLLQAEEFQQESIEEEEPFSLTIYHLSNSGQGPGLNIYHLPFEISGFLRIVQQPRYRQQWQAIVQRAWERPPKTKRKPKKPFQPSRNWLYEDLFDLPDNAAQFIRTYFLRVALRYARNKNDPRDPRVDYSLQQEAQLVSWKITSLFLRRVMHMDKDRIEKIREFGDQLADYIFNQNDKFIFTNFRTQNYHQFRTMLLRANLAEVKRGNSPIINFDSYVEIFELAENDASPGWRLARDLVFIRLIERLYQLGWLDSNPDTTEAVINSEIEQ